MYSRGLLTIFISTLALAAITAAADDFGDVTASASAMYSGNTFHGYAEIRVALENHSPGKAHVVTLVFPNVAWNNGNTLRRVSRTVRLEPNAREIALLLRPPLPANSDGNLRVEVDGQREGQIRAPNANNHCNYNSRGRPAATVFISRSLDYDAVEKLFQADHGAFTASMAVGPPNASGGGYQSTTWMPDVRSYSKTNWLELDYATPQAVSSIEIYNVRSPTSPGLVELIGVGGTNIATISMSSGGTRPGSSGWVNEFSFTTTSEPVKTVRLSFWRVPPGNIGIDAVQISGPAGPQWATAARASSDNSASAGAYAPGGAAADAVESLRAESPVSEWSENWLAYSPFDGMVLNAEDLSALPPAVLAAIGDYLQAGGNVVLAGQTGLPVAWHPVQKRQLPDGMEFKVGFGRCFTFPVENLAQLSTNSVEALKTSVRDAARYWQGLPDDSAAANAALPVVTSLKIPTRGLVILMLAFIILIGPVNIIYLGRRKRRAWMLWTIPAISFATTMLVFAYSLLREGITPDTRIAGLTLIDQASRHATTIGATAFYCPLTPSGGLQFDYDTEATPLVRSGYGSGTSREVDWTEAQHLQHGWVSARVPAHFHLRKSEARRERIQIVNQAGKLQMVNGLGVPIQTLWYADANMKIFEANNVDAGGKGALVLSSQSATSEKSGPEGLLRDIGYAASTHSLYYGIGNYLLPNSYIAVLDGNPFIENALGGAASAKRTKSSSVVFGILEPSPAP
jgi:hypothetical protein